MPAPQNVPALNLLYQGSWGLIPISTSAMLIFATTTTDVIEIQPYNSATAFLGVSSASGTLNAFIQTQMPDGITWVDYAAFNSVTTATHQIAGLVSAGNSINNGLGLGLLPAGTVRTIPLGMRWRWVFQIPTTGTTGPSIFTYTAGISFYG